MDDTAIKSQLSELNRNVSELIRKANQEIPSAAEAAFHDWQKTCEICEKRLDDDRLRMAVVGTIKSGKSTFINSLFGGDYLKRGAGVITSIVTRVRRSDRLQAKLYFKSWDEINQEINQALRIFSSTAWRSAEESFDIRQSRDRAELAEALNALEARHFLTKDSRNVNGVLLNAYLKGYDTVKD
ncbi:MAG: dynamin family protein, partial [Thermodesulfobacteriota bacterium]